MAPIDLNDGFLHVLRRDPLVGETVRAISKTDNPWHRHNRPFVVLEVTDNSVVHEISYDGDGTRTSSKAYLKPYFWFDLIRGLDSGATVTS